ncbi:MAG TPA: TfoX/Sxy family protein [Candidatus Dormibacteraeota bacterium]|nr:TfoX/Sxy family protein [Candidatus Dormibacteraeota bacterium]
MSPSEMGPMPTTTDALKDAFRDLVPPGDGVGIKPMFGNLAAFVNGNMFAGLFGEKLFVRVADADRDRLLAAGGGDFAPMAGRPMKGYVTLPDGWRSDQEGASSWVELALAATSAMPPKQPKPKKRK